MPNPANATVLDLAERWAAWEAERRQLEARLEHVKDQLQALDEPLRAAIIEADVKPPYRVEKYGLTVSVRQELWPGPKDGDMDALCSALRASGLTAMVKESVHHMTLAGYVREQIKNGTPLPPLVAETVVVKEKFSLRARAISTETTGALRRTELQNSDDTENI